MYSCRYHRGIEAGLSRFRTCHIGFFFALAYLEPFMAKLGSFQESRFMYFSSYSVLINMLLYLYLLLKVLMPQIIQNYVETHIMECKRPACLLR